MRRHTRPLAPRPPRDKMNRMSRPPILAGLPAPLRWGLGMGLLSLCLWLPAFVALFR